MKLIIGVKGTGKTKTLIEMVNSTIDSSNGSVICIEKGDKLKFDIKYQCRLIDSDEYFVCDAQSLFGFIAGIFASNHDVTDPVSYTHLDVYKRQRYSDRACRI